MKHIDQSALIDPLEMARFFTLPGAARLLTAFGAIPPGPLRDSVISHAEVIAATYQSAPPEHRMPDPIARFAPAAPSVQMIAQASRTGKAPPTESLEAQAVKLAIGGTSATEIAEKIGRHISWVYAALAAARKAGVPVPKRSKGTPKLAQTDAHWATTVETLSAQGLRAIERAADARKITPEAYMERRQLALKLAMEGAGYDRILIETGETDSKIVSAWMSVARAAGYAVPYLTSHPHVDQETPEERSFAPTPSDPPPPVQTAPSGRIFPNVEDMTPKEIAAVRHAASRRNLTVQAYHDLRESILAHRQADKTPSEIGVLTGESQIFVKDTLAMAVERGVTLNPLSHRGVNPEPAQLAA